jgi:hypothetical protein
VTDEEARAYYREHRENYPSVGYGEVAAMIRDRLSEERQRARFLEFRQELREAAMIEIDEVVLATVSKGGSESE